MVIKNYGFIVKGKGYKPSSHRSVLDSGSFKTTIVGVETEEQAIEIARQMCAEGIQIVELCGGFDPKSADTIMDELQNSIPVGYVIFSKKAQNLMKDG